MPRPAWGEKVESKRAEIHGGAPGFGSQDLASQSALFERIAAGCSRSASRGVGGDLRFIAPGPLHSGRRPCVAQVGERVTIRAQVPRVSACAKPRRQKCECQSRSCVCGKGSC